MRFFGDYWQNFGELIGRSAAAGGGVAELNVIAPEITPSYGSERLENGDFETMGAGGTDVFASWNETVAGTSTIADEGTLVHGGSHAAKMTVDNSNSNANLRQSKCAVGEWNEYAVWARADSGTPTFFMGNDAYHSYTLSADYQQFTGSQWGTVGNFLFNRENAANRVIYGDDFSIRQIVFATTHELVGTHKKNGQYVCTPTVPATRQAGIMICYADDNNYVLALVDRFGGNRIRLISCVAGVKTSLLYIVVTYGAAKELRVNVRDGVYTVFYDNVQVGTSQVIADETLGTQVHAFSTHSTASAGTISTSSVSLIESAAMTVAEFNAIPAHGDDFSVVYLPDTQLYSQLNNGCYEDQTQWIVDNAAALNIQCVLHEGDVVQTTVQDEYDVAVAAQAILQSANIPNLISAGDHDYPDENYTGRDLTLFLSNFPASYYTSKAWFNGGMYNDVPPNVWFTRTIGTRNYLFMCIETSL